MPDNRSSVLAGDRGADGGLGHIERYRGARDVLTFSNGDEYP